MVERIARISPISRGQTGRDNFATLVTTIVALYVSYIIICNGLAMTNSLRTDTRVHEHAVSNNRVSYCDSAALVRVQEGRIPRVSSYTTTAW